MANSNTSELTVTRQKAPTMALKFLLDNFESITLTQLEKEHRLNRSTLYRISGGEAIPRGYEAYMHVFVSILYAKRRLALLTRNRKQRRAIDRLLRDMTLVQYGMPTDEELRIVVPKKKKRV